MRKRSISHEKGRGNLAHNNRDFFSNNIHKDRTKDNVIIKQQTLKDAYNECFGEAVTEYNAKQKRSDRRIDDYFQHLFSVSADSTTARNVLQSRARGQGICTKSFYEDLIQVGDMNDTGITSNPQAAELAKRALLVYINGDARLGIKSYMERNPHFHVFNAVIHTDEATPHLHIDYIPVATGYKTGLAVRNGYNKALEQMGYSGSECFRDWRDKERDVFRNICRRLGLNPKDKEEEEKARGTLTPDQYRKKMKEANDMADKIINNATEKTEEIIQSAKQKAREEAKKIISDADKTAKEIVASAEHKAKEIMAGAVEERDRKIANDTPKYSKRNGKAEANQTLEKEYLAAREKYEKLTEQTKKYAALWEDHIAKTRNPNDIFNNGDDEPFELEIARNKKQSV